MTRPEWKVWYHLRAKRFGHWKFRRQVPMGQYVVDFVCERACLIVEIDGGQHNERREQDEQRTSWLNAQGYSVLRFWNNEVVENMDGVLTTILKALPPPRPSPKGEGDFTSSPKGEGDFTSSPKGEGDFTSSRPRLAPSPSRTRRA